MTKKRFNLWMDTTLIREIKQEAKTVGLNHLSSYVRVASVEKMRRDQRARGEIQGTGKRQVEDTPKSTHGRDSAVQYGADGGGGG